MALKVDYVVRETGTNLKRNLTLSFATMVTIAIALTLVGAALLMKQGVAKSNVRFHGDIQTIVYMNATASQDQIDAVKRSLQQNPHVGSISYLDHDAAFKEFQQLFFDQEAIKNSLTPAETPTSYKIKFNGDANAAVVQSLKDQFIKLPGVYDVIAPSDQVRRQEDSFAKFSNFALIIALIVGVTSLVLIVNSIRIAMFARRREIEVMKLVGATNWFIRVPFMAEGLVQGMLGSAIGIGTVAALRSWMLPTLVSGGGIWTGFHVDVSDLRGTSYVLIIAGGLVGIFGSAVAATRFLDV
ncbi:MAG TPA: permease-like cell division protein FtsX [Acidimicrobiales bacterium]|jgi:cell division transport system permease protein|nr:permease-like cell division protein FtsX [Acidimicrobiales bacterium]